MNDKIYKSSLNNITVSEDVFNEVISKAVLIKDKKAGKSVKYSRLIILAAAILATSVITVTAASYLGVADVFKDFYSQFFRSEAPEFTQGQKDFLEKHGAAKLGGFSENGIKLDIEGLIGDRNYLFLKYSISYDLSSDSFIHYSEPKLYVEDETGLLHPLGYSSSFKLDNSLPGKMNYTTIFQCDSDKLFSVKNAVFVMTDKETYQPIGMDISDTYNKYGIFASVNSQDFFDKLSEVRINTPFDNVYGGKIILNSLGFADNSLTVFVDSSGYFKRPELFLRNKKTGMVYSEYNGFNFGTKADLTSYSFEFESVDALKDLEMVMPKEFHFKFPLSYVDSTRNIDLGKLSSLMVGDIRIAKLNISPLSLGIDGYCTDGLTNNIDLTIKLKDMTELSGFKNHSGSGGDSHFKMKVPFESPIMLDSIKSIVIKYGDDAVEIPIEYSQN